MIHFDKDNLNSLITNIIAHADSVMTLSVQCYKKDLQKIITTDEKFYLEKIQNNATSLKFEAQQVIKNVDEVKISLDKYFEKIRHDLRNKINSIIGYTEILLENCVDKSTSIDAKKLQHILSNAKIILNYVNDLRDVNSLLHNIKTTSLDSRFTIKEPVKEEEISPELITFKQNFKILIVDDVEENCQLLEKHLLRMGYININIAFDAKEAKKIIMSKQIDLVLLDIDMPGISGMTLLEELKNEISQLQIMVIMITGSDTMENAIKSIKLGAEDFLTKPIDIEMLKVRINTCLNKKWFIMKEKEYAECLKLERNRYEILLNAIFPPKIVKELSETGHVLARSYNNVAMLFTDVVDFTHYCSTNKIEDIIQGIQDFSVICEDAASKYNLQKIKTIGDGFLAIAGMLTEHQNPVLDCIRCAKEILENTKKAKSQWLVRAGIDYGTIIGGVVGHRQYLFDVWGDSVNIASHVQSAADPDRICLTERAWRTVNHLCDGRPLGIVNLKGKNQPMELFEFLQMKKIKEISKK